MLRTLFILCVLTLSACFTQPPPATCFSDGAVNDQDPLLSDFCCAPGEEGDIACQAFFREDARSGALAALAVCEPNGFCAIDCQPGQNCACTSGTDCDQTCTDNGGNTVPCGCTVISDPSGDQCEGQGLASVKRCAICRECLTDTDCDDIPEGDTCLEGLCQ